MARAVNIPSATSPIAISLGTYLVLILYGQAIQGAYQYFRRYPKDGYDLKTLIAALVIFDTLHMICATHICYASLTGGTSDSYSGETFVSFVSSLWSFAALIPSSALILIIAHCFYARRVYKLGRQSMVFNIFMITLALLLIGNVILYIVASVTMPTGIWVQIIVIVTFNILLLSNIALTWRLVSHLKKSRTGFKSTETLINRLIHVSVNTGILTGLLTLASIILLSISNNDFVYFPVATIVAPVHVSVVLAALNSRRSLVDRGSEGIELRSFDLDIAPRLNGDSETIQFAAPSGVIGRGGASTVRSANAIEVELAPPEGADVEVASAKKGAA